MSQYQVADGIKKVHCGGQARRCDDSIKVAIEPESENGRGPEQSLQE